MMNLRKFFTSKLSQVFQVLGWSFILQNHAAFSQVILPLEVDLTFVHQVSSSQGSDYSGEVTFSLKNGQNLGAEINSSSVPPLGLSDLKLQFKLKNTSADSVTLHSPSAAPILLTCRKYFNYDCAVELSLLQIADPFSLFFWKRLPAGNYVLQTSDGKKFEFKGNPVVSNPTGLVQQFYFHGDSIANVYTEFKKEIKSWSADPSYFRTRMYVIQKSQNVASFDLLDLQFNVLQYGWSVGSLFYTELDLTQFGVLNSAGKLVPQDDTYLLKTQFQNGSVETKRVKFRD